MSQKEKREEENPAEPSPNKPGGKPKGKSAAKSSKETTEKPGMDYVFKIAPADPKNAFNFEDVADK